MPRWTLNDCRSHPDSERHSKFQQLIDDENSFVKSFQLHFEGGCSGALSIECFIDWCPDGTLVFACVSEGILI